MGSFRRVAGQFAGNCRNAARGGLLCAGSSYRRDHRRCSVLCAVAGRNFTISQCQPATTLARRIVAEAPGTAMLSAAIVGSGIMAERLAGGRVAIALLANAIATGAALGALILTFGGISGAHFNPAVTVGDWLRGGLSKTDTLALYRRADYWSIRRRCRQCNV